MDYLLDSNFIINYFKGLYQGDARIFTDNVINGITRISVISRIELLGWWAISDEDQKIINDFINDSFIFPLDEDIIIKTIFIRKKYRIKLPDAIIAATALIHDLEIISHNVKDFEKVDGLKILVPENLQDKIR